MSRTIAASLVRTCLAPSIGTAKSAARCIYLTSSRRNDLKLSPSRVSSRAYTSSSAHSEARLEHPALNQLKDDLTVLQPCFGVRGDEVDVLFEPADFHRRLLTMIKKAKRRILISALYIGTEQGELIEALREALTNNPHLRVSIITDLLRSTREQSPNPSTATMLLPLVAEFPDRVDACFYRSPKLKGLMERIVPRRYDEGWGLWHCKWYGADDEVIFSGANLSDSYFTNRQDRYYHVKNQPSILSYLYSLQRLYSSYAYRLTPSPQPSSSPHHLIPLIPLPDYQPKSQTSRPALVWPQPSVHPRSFQHHALATITASQRVWREIRRGRRVDVDTWIFPMIQGGALGVGEEERGVGRFLACAEKMLPDSDSVSTGAESQGQGAQVDLTSGYFGLYHSYKKAVLDGKAPYRIVAASPEANGFFGSAGVSRLIPEGYTLLESQFHRDLVRRGRDWAEAPGGSGSGVELNEWKREGWTYHAKGIWLTPAGPPGLTTPQHPSATFIGSSNLSTRSLKLDLELSNIILTTSTELRSKMAAELKNIRGHSERVGEETWRLPERHVSLYARLLMMLGVEGML